MTKYIYISSIENKKNTIIQGSFFLRPNGTSKGRPNAMRF